MRETKNIANSEHYNWGGACDGWHLVRSDGLSVIEERMPPNMEEQSHHHVLARQFFYVLEGELTMQFDDDTAVISSFHGLEIAPLVTHQARNATNAPVRFLVISQPPSHGDRIPTEFV